MQTAIYKGRKYQLLYSGQTKYGQKAKLGFWDGSKEFWVDLDKVEIQSGSSRSGAPRGKYECDECGDYVSPGTRCWETGCMH